METATWKVNISYEDAMRHFTTESSSPAHKIVIVYNFIVENSNISQNKSPFSVWNVAM